MAMTQQQFDSLVARLEKSAARHPGLYKLRLGFFATLGYLYIFVVVALLLVASAVVLVLGKALAAKLAIALLVLVGVALRSLWVKIDPPTGLELTRRDYPTLFGALDEIRLVANAPRAHVVLLTNDLNAAINQVPRLGMFGWQTNYLLLGLPLMQMLSLDEFEAVLAHEFGHLSGAHGRFGAWIYRLRTSWGRLADTLRAREHWGSFLFVPFFAWFAPTFAAYSFVQARMQEYEADRAAASRHGGQALANALIRLDLKGQELAQRYWPGVYKAADEMPSPAGAPYRGLLGPESRGFLPSAPEQLRHSLERETSTADTHPSLRDRVAAMKVEAGVPPPFEVSAARSSSTSTRSGRRTSRTGGPAAISTCRRAARSSRPTARSRLPSSQTTSSTSTADSRKSSSTCRRQRSSSKRSSSAARDTSPDATRTHASDCGKATRPASRRSRRS